MSETAAPAHAPEQIAALVGKPRDNAGRFTKKTKLSKSQRSTQSMQRLLSKETDGKSLEIQMAEHLAKTVLESGTDQIVGAAKAFETLEARAWGKVKENEETLDAMQRASVSFVIIQAPELKPMPEPSPQPLKPSFAEATFITNAAPLSEARYNRS